MTKPKLVGTGDITRLYGLTRVQVFRLISTGDWPEEAAHTGGGRVWEGGEIEETVKRLRDAGRITSDNRLVPWRYLEARPVGAAEH